MNIGMNPYQQYQNNQVDTADPKQLIIMLYEGGIRFLEKAAEYIERFQTYDQANTNMLKAQDILSELMLSLDMDKGGEIASNLFNLYSYMKKELLDANIKKEKEKILSVINMLAELKTAWVSLEVKPSEPSIPISDNNSSYEPFIAQG